MTAAPCRRAVAACLAASSPWLFAACGAAAPPASVAPLRVRAAVARTEYLPDEVSGFGSLSFSEKSDVSSPQDGVIDSLPYREGDAVAAGAIVAILRNPQIELAVARAENGVEQARVELSLADARLFEGLLAAESRLLGIARARGEAAQARRELAEAERKVADEETLFLAGGITEESLRSARFAVETAQERVRLMEQDIDIRLVGLRDEDLRNRGMPVPEDGADRSKALGALATAALRAEREAASVRLDAARKELASARIASSELRVAAPRGGVIGARYLDVGERARRDDKLLTVMDVGALYAVARIGEAEAVRLSRGMEAVVTVGAAGASFGGTVDLVSPVADASSASFSVRVRLSDPAAVLRPGMFALVSIRAGPPRSALVVPDGAVVDRDGKVGKAFVLSGETVHERRVSLGELVEAGRVITAGLAADDVVVDGPDPSLKEGDRASLSE